MTKQITISKRIQCYLNLQEKKTNLQLVLRKHGFKKRDNLIEKATTFDTPSQHNIFCMQISEKRLSMEISRQRYCDSFYKSNHC